MRWLTVAGVLLYLTRCNDAGVLKCHPGSRDPLCAKNTEISSNLIERDSSSEEVEKKLFDIGLISDESHETQCLPGTNWESHCHSCHCTRSGLAECVEIPSCIGDHYAEPIPCKPNSTFKRYGETCVCLQNGQGICALQSHNVKKRSPEEEKCTPGSSFQIECNTCHCLDNGRAACTKRGCLGVIGNTHTIDIHKREITEVEPSSSPATTKVETKTNNTRVVCLANRMFIKDCNTCWCNEDGTSYFCTRKVCLENNGGDGEDPDEELKLRVVRKECTPNEVFEMDCNMCRCNEDGKSFSCTRRACIEVDDKNTTSRSARALSNSETPKTCQAGQEFRMDCNKCLCNNGGTDFSCTRIDCAALNNGAADRTKRDTTTVEQKCEPGSVFDRACNVCRCTADGLHAVCQLKRCNKDTDGSTTESSPAFRCTPGDQFRRDCNDCTCSADGKNVFCTLRLCDDPSITP